MWQIGVVPWWWIRVVPWFIDWGGVMVGLL